MKQFNILKGTQGWLTMYARVIRLRHMRNQKEVERRVKILVFWEVHGDQATHDAFGVSRRTLYRWRGALSRAQGKIDALDPKSTAPQKRRTRAYPPRYLDQVVALRREHRRLGKKKIATLLGVSESYAGRTLSDLKKRGQLPTETRMSPNGRSGRVNHYRYHRRKKHRRPHGARVVQIDTVTRFIDGIKRYVVTAIDTETRFAFAGTYTTHSSKSAADFLTRYQRLAPIPALQTDNGSEFAGYFDQACDRSSVPRYHTYPRSPKMNAHVERFNRTLSEDFIAPNRALLRDDPAAFNVKLTDWLIWYNTIRPHQALGMLSPLRYMMQGLPARECQKYWTSTVA